MQGGKGVDKRVVNAGKTQKYDANACFFLSEASAATKMTNGVHQGTLKLIQCALMIANFLSDRPVQLGIDIKIASIGKGDYCVVKKEPLFVCGLSVVLFFRELRKFKPPTRKKKLMEKLGRTPYCFMKPS